MDAVDRREANKFPESKYRCDELASAQLSAEMHEMFKGNDLDPEKRLGGSVFILNGLKPELEVGNKKPDQILTT